MPGGPRAVVAMIHPVPTDPTDHPVPCHKGHGRNDSLHRTADFTEQTPANHAGLTLRREITGRQETTGRRDATGRQDAVGNSKLREGNRHGSRLL
jgi:hypothetical protein